MEYIEIKDGKVIGHYSAAEMPEGKQFREVQNFTGIIGAPENQLSESGELLSEQEIIDNGILTPGDNEAVILEDGGYVIKADYRNQDYWIKDTGEKVKFNLGESPDNTMTDVIREDSESEWNGTEWIVPDSVLKIRARTERDQKLLETDYIMMPDYPCGNKADFEAYRQALRDITEQSGFPKTIDWPLKPEIQA